MTLDEIVTELIRQPVSLDDANRAMIRRALFHYGYMSTTCAKLKISRNRLYRLMQKFGIKPSDLKEYRRRQLTLHK